MTDIARPQLESSPVSCIPPEILIRILQMHTNATTHAFGESQSGFPTCSRGLNPYSWIRISHVCQRWRAVSLSCPLLWSSIFVTHHTDCMRAMLERSQQVPLDVRTGGGTGCYLSRPFPLKSLRLVLTELRRIRSLDLAINWWMYDDIAELLQRPAPFLRKLQLSTPNGGYDGGWLCPVMSVSRQEDLAQLEEISLNCYVFPWVDPSPFRTLKSLEIDNRGLAKPSIEEVACALGNMPRLVTLTLHGILYGGHPEILARAKPEVIAMPMLEQLTLSGDSIACSTILRLLSFPSNTRLTLNFASDRDSDALALSMTSVGHKLIPPEDVTASLLHVGTSCKVHIHSTPSDQGTTHIHSNSRHPKLNLAIPLSIDHIEAVCRHLQLAGSSVLHVTPLPLEDASSARPSYFGHFGDLGEVHLAHWQPTEITALLLLGLDENMPADRMVAAHEVPIDDAQRAVLPSLRTLRLSEVQFTGIANGLRDALDTRRGRKLALDKLVLRNCSGLSATDIAALTAVVGTLDWDSKGLDHSSCTYTVDVES